MLAFGSGSWRCAQRQLEHAKLSDGPLRRACFGMRGCRAKHTGYARLVKRKAQGMLCAVRYLRATVGMLALLLGVWIHQPRLADDSWPARQPQQVVEPFAPLLQRARVLCASLVCPARAADPESTTFEPLRAARRS